MQADIGTSIVESAFGGYNSSVFAYGQTGAGKSYTMTGSKDDPGLIPRLADALFARVAAAPAETKYMVEVSYMEIYNERLSDLLMPDGDKNALKIRESASGVYVQGLTKQAVKDYKSMLRAFDDGSKSRAVAATKMNAVSSRSHAILTIYFSQAAASADEGKGKGKTAAGKAKGKSKGKGKDGKGKARRRSVLETAGVRGKGGAKPKNVKVSRIHLVDLAGSERQESTGATGDRLKEACAINKSLSVLGNVISALAKGSDFVPYRDSVLTKFLHDSLGGNSRTFMLAAISPASANYDETLSTLRYADRAKHIINKAVVNEDPDERLIRELKEEVARLRSELTSSGGARPSTPGGTFDPEAAAEAEWQKKVLKDEVLMRERMLQDLELTWEEKLEAATRAAAQREKQLEFLGLSSNDSPDSHQFINLNEDPIMTEKLIFPLHPGTMRIGRKVHMAESMSPKGDGTFISTAPDIALMGMSIARHHCDVIVEDETVTLRPVDGCKTYVNGVQILGDTILSLGNRIVFGQHHIFRYHHPRLAAAERKRALAAGGTAEMKEVVDWESASLELAEALGTMTALRDEADRKLEAKKREAEETKARLEAEKAKVQAELEARLKELQQKTAELEAARKQANTDLANLSDVDDDSAVRQRLAAIERELSEQQDEFARVKAEWEREVEEKTNKLDKALARNKQKTWQFAAKLIQRDARLKLMEARYMKILGQIDEANEVSRAMGKELFFRCANRTYYGPTGKRMDLSALVTHERLNGTYEIAEAGLPDHMDRISEVYDDWTEEPGKAVTGDDPFDVTAEADLLGTAVVKINIPNSANPEVPIQQSVPIRPSLPGESGGEMLVEYQSEGCLGDLLDKDVELALCIRSVKGIPKARKVWIQFRFLEDEWTKSAAANNSTAATKCKVRWSGTFHCRPLTVELLHFLKNTGIAVEVWGVRAEPKRAHESGSITAGDNGEAASEAMEKMKKEHRAQLVKFMGRVEDLRRKFGEKMEDRQAYIGALESEVTSLREKLKIMNVTVPEGAKMAEYRKTRERAALKLWSTSSSTITDFGSQGDLLQSVSDARDAADAPTTERRFPSGKRPDSAVSRPSTAGSRAKTPQTVKVVKVARRDRSSSSGVNVMTSARPDPVTRPATPGVPQ